MFTLAQARRAIGNDTYFMKGRTYAQEGRVESLHMRVQGERRIFTGEVRGHGYRYAVEFDFDEGRNRFTRCSCDCPAFERASFGCKHVAALMIAACTGRQDGLFDEKRPGEGDLGLVDWFAQVRRQREEEMRALQERREREARERMEQAARERKRWEREERERFVQVLIDGLPALSRRLANPGESCVRIQPILGLQEGNATLELRIGRTRMYRVKNIGEFAEHVRAGAWAEYGRELAFAHGQEAFDPRDLPLLRHIALLAEGTQGARAAKLSLRGAALDQTMRLLLGRTAGVRTQDGRVIQAPVCEQQGRISLAVRKKKDGAVLYVSADRAAAGDEGIYFLDEDAVRCVFGPESAHMRALLRIAGAYPDGLQLDGRQLGIVCARLIAPAMERLMVTEGEAILRDHLPMAMTPRFYVDMDDAGRLICRVRFAYGDALLAPEEENPAIRRDTALEEAAEAAARALFPDTVGRGEYAFEGGDEACFALLTERLSALEGQGEVLIAQRLAQMNVQRRRSITFGMVPSGTRLLIRADLGYTQEELDAAYAAYRQKRRFVRFTSGVFLSGEALEQAAQTARLLEGLDTTVQELASGADVPMMRAMYLDEAIRGRENVTLSAPKALRDWMDRLTAAQRTRAVPPAGLAATLRGYQLEGLSWLCALGEAGFGGILADDMGLGKTVQALAMLLCAKERGERVRALVVCPASLQLNWQAEAARFAPGLSCGVLAGTAQKRAQQIAREDAPELLISSYDQLRRDAQAYAGIELSHVLLDEAQYIKNAASQAAKAAKTLCARRRFAMTGTPVENRLSELWSIFDFLMPGYLYGYKKFRERFEMPIVRDESEDTQKNLRLMVAPFILRRMKRDVLSDLPEKVETRMTSRMTPEQERLYAAYADRLTREAQSEPADARGRMKILAGLTKLRQICCDPRLCVEGYAGGSGKLGQCLDVVAGALAAGHRILLFSQFTSMLALLETALRDQGVETLTLTGETDKKERMRLTERFNAGCAQVFLISLKAGGTGLNLTGADVVIHYDPWWNTAARNQATDRAYRIGQTRGVQVIDLIAAGTIEERIMLLQEQKRALSDGILEGEENLFTLDAAMLRELLRA